MFWMFWKAFILSLQNFQNNNNLYRKEGMPVLFNLLGHERSGNMPQGGKRFHHVLDMPWPRQLPFAGQRREVGAVCFGEDSVGWRENGSGVDSTCIWIGDRTAEGKIKP